MVVWTRWQLGLPLVLVFVMSSGILGSSKKQLWTTVLGWCSVGRMWRRETHVASRWCCSLGGRKVSTMSLQEGRGRRGRTEPCSTVPAHSEAPTHVTRVDNLQCWEPAGGLTCWGDILLCKNSHENAREGLHSPTCFGWDPSPPRLHLAAF